MKACERWRALTVAILTTACAAFFSHHQFCYHFYHESNGDLGSYLDVIQSGRNVGWWAPITLGLLHQFCTGIEWLRSTFPSFAPDEHLSVLKFYLAVCRLVALLFAFSAGTLAFAAVRCSRQHLVTVGILCVFAFLLPLEINLGSRLDYFFVAEAFAALALLRCMDALNIWWKCTASVCYFVVLLLMIDARHNAILTLPLFLGAWGWKLFPGMRPGKMVLFILLAGITTAAAKKGAEAYYVNRSALNPSHVMLLSDLRMAAILRGEYENYAYRNPRPRAMADWVHPDTEKEAPSMRQFFHSRHKRLKAATVSELQHVYDQPSDISDIIDEYWREWGKHPKELLMARLITLEQFFTGNEHGPWEKALVSTVCPAVRDNEVAWGESTRHPRFSGEGMDAVRISALTIYAISLAIGIAFAISLYRRRLSLQDNTVRSATLALAVAFTYLLSFLIVTPTSDFRYHYPALALLCYGAPILLLTLLRRSARPA